MATGATTDAAPLATYAALAQEAERLEVRRRQANQEFRRAEDALVALRREAATRYIKDFEQRMAPLREAVTEAKKALEAVNARRRALGDQQRLLVAEATGPLEYEDWPVQALVEELRRLQQDQARLTKVLASRVTQAH